MGMNTGNDDLQGKTEKLLSCPTSYQAGDILEIRPENSPVEVDEFLRMMKWEDQANQTYEVKSRTKGA